MDEEQDLLGLVAMVLLIFAVIVVVEIAVNSKPHDYQRLDTDWNDKL